MALGITYSKTLWHQEGLEVSLTVSMSM